MTLNQLAVKVAKEFNIKPSQLKGGRGPSAVFTARWAFIFLAIDFVDPDKDALAKWLGLTRNGINYVLRAIECELEQYPKYRAKVNKIAGQIKA